MAWLDAAPINKPKSPHESPPKPVQRRSVIEDPDMPPLEHGHLMLGYFLEIIRTTQSDTGICIISYGHIRDWMHITGSSLTPDYAGLIIDLSIAYVSQHSLSLEPSCPAPYKPAKLDQKAAAQSIKRGLRGIGSHVIRG